MDGKGGIEYIRINLNITCITSSPEWQERLILSEEQEISTILWVQW